MTLVVIATNIYRCPPLLSAPRFWAEEGKDYFSYAFSHSWLEMLFTPQFGYNTLYNSLACSLAARFPLEVAPLVTTYLALLVQLLASFIVIWGDNEAITSLKGRFAVAMAIPLLAYQRIWLTTIGVQYWLCIITFLILLRPPPVRSRVSLIGNGGLLLLAGLTGVLSCFMTPAFMLKAAVAKARQFTVYATILAVCSLLQVGVFLRAWLSHDPGIAQRLVHNDPAALAIKTITFQFAVPFIASFQLPLGARLMEESNRMLVAALGTTLFSVQSLFTTVIGCLILLFFIMLAAKRPANLNTQLMILSFVLVATLSTLFSLNMSGGPRYTFAPGVMLIAFLVSSWRDPWANPGMQKLFRRSAGLLVGVALLSNTLQFQVVMLPPGAPSYSANWPRWQDEVAAWRLDNRYPLRIWPPPWFMLLNKGG